jgi:hypothetical protein
VSQVGSAAAEFLRDCAGLKGVVDVTLVSRLLALSLALVAGCGGGVNIAQVDPKTGFHLGPINNGSLQSDAEIETGRALYQERLMQCWIEIQSHLNDSQKLYYKWNWFDADGAPLQEEGWHFVPFKGNERKTVMGTATAPGATRAEFLLRRRSTDDHEN